MTDFYLSVRWNPWLRRRFSLWLCVHRRDRNLANCERSDMYGVHLGYDMALDAYNTVLYTGQGYRVLWQRPAARR